MANTSATPKKKFTETEHRALNDLRGQYFTARRQRDRYIKETGHGSANVSYQSGLMVGILRGIAAMEGRGYQAVEAELRKVTS